jgi:ribosome biogenesis protein SSF1/2
VPLAKTRAHRNGNSRNPEKVRELVESAADRFSSEARARLEDPDPTAMAKTRRKKRRTHLDQNAGREAPGGKGDIPKSFVIKRGKMSELVKELTEDVRHVMEPHTAKNLKESKTNKLKDFVQVAGPLGVSHFIILSATENSKYVKIAKTPRGPTLTFKVNKYTLAREVAAAQRNPRAPANAFLSPPLVVLNNFGDAPHQKLATITFQNLFPAINVRKVKLSTCQRAVLVDYDKESNKFQFRHYSINAVPTGINRHLKKLLTKNKVPDLGRLTDIGDFFEAGANSGHMSEFSDSEGEDAVNARVELAQDYNRHSRANTTSRVKLQEIGPRMEMELVKVEEGMCEGRVLYHAYVDKTEDEVKELETRAVDKEALRKRRREEQERNVAKKAKEKAEKEKIEEEMAALGARKRKRDKKKEKEKDTKIARKGGKGLDGGKGKGAKKSPSARPGKSKRIKGRTRSR